MPLVCLQLLEDHTLHHHHWCALETAPYPWPSQTSRRSTRTRHLRLVSPENQGYTLRVASRALTSLAAKLCLIGSVASATAPHPSEASMEVCQCHRKMCVCAYVYQRQRAGCTCRQLADLKHVPPRSPPCEPTGSAGHCLVAVLAAGGDYSCRSTTSYHKLSVIWNAHWTIFLLINIIS